MSETSAQSERRAARRAVVALAVFGLFTAAVFWLDPSDLHLWIKAIHVIAVIAWMAGMLYLPRLFVYHSDAAPGSTESETFKVMERRLLRVIMNPAMTIAWALGLWLAWSGGYFTSGWFHAKLAAVLAMSAVHGVFSKAVRLFAEDRNEKPARYWRIMNEVPTVLMIAIVILVVVKPF
ncbi:MAG: protoporphyrinogen oxidase HemJ [Oricola sp.]